MEQLTGKCIITDDDLTEENVFSLKMRIAFLEAHNKALMHTNKQLHHDLKVYHAILESEYFEDAKWEKKHD